jgi:hypothetical protein
MNPKSQNPAMLALVYGISDQSDAGEHLHEWHARRFPGGMSIADVIKQARPMRKRGVKSASVSQ